MPSLLTVLAQGISVLTCFALPIAGWLLLRRRFRDINRAFFAGMLTFFVSQIVLRIPLITLLLPEMLWYGVLNQYPVALAAFTGLTAGLFEEAGRYFFVKLMLRNNRRYEDALAFGVGHAGIEAVLMVGLSAMLAFVFAILINSGIPGLEDSAALYGTLLSMTPTDGFMTAVERISATGLHIGFTVIVFEGFHSGHPLRATGLAALLHGAVDMLAVLMYSVWGWNVFYVQGVLLLISASMLLHVLKARERFPASPGGSGDEKTPAAAGALTDDNAILTGGDEKTPDVEGALTDNNTIPTGGDEETPGGGIQSGGNADMGEWR